MEKDGLAKSSNTSIEKEGFISQSLSTDGIPNQSLPDDHIGIENITVEPNKLYEAVSALRNYGFNYLQCQGGYDEGPVSYTHLRAHETLENLVFSENTGEYLNKNSANAIPPSQKEKITELPENSEKTEIINSLEN